MTNMMKLTEQQRVHWATDGYLHLKNVLTPEEVEAFSQEMDSMRQVPGWEPSPEGPRGHYTWMDHTPDLDTTGNLDRRELLPYHSSFIDLVDRPNVFDLIVDIMGPYLLLSMTQAIVRTPSETFGGYIHTDGGEALRRIRVTETSRPLAMKAMYLLTDMNETGIGNFTVFPGSHMRPFPEDASPATLNPKTPGAVQLCGSAGDCIIFPHSLWHGPSPNPNGEARKTLLYNYCQLFVRAYDFETVASVKDRCTPRQRRLMGDLGHPFRPGSYTYAPEDQVEVIMNGAG